MVLSQGVFLTDSKERANEVIALLNQKFGIDTKFFTVFKSRYGPDNEYMVSFNLVEKITEYLSELKGVY